MLLLRFSGHPTFSGAAEEPSAVFGEAAALSIQKQYMQQLPSSLGLNMYNDERNTTSVKNTSSEDYSPSQPKHTQGHGLKDISGNFHSHGLLVLSLFYVFGLAFYPITYL